MVYIIQTVTTKNIFIDSRHGAIYYQDMRDTFQCESCGTVIPISETYISESGERVCHECYLGERLDSVALDTESTGSGYY